MFDGGKREAEGRWISLALPQNLNELATLRTLSSVRILVGWIIQGD